MIYGKGLVCAILVTCCGSTPFIQVLMALELYTSVAAHVLLWRYTCAHKIVLYVWMYNTQILKVLKALLTA